MPITSVESDVDEGGVMTAKRKYVVLKAALNRFARREYNERDAARVMLLWALVIDARVALVRARGNVNATERA